MRNIYVVTHPEATHHVDHLVGGWFDSELTERGVLHAHAIASALAARIVDGASIEVRSSDLRRASTTAAVIAARLEVEVVLDRDLREKSYGGAGGKPQSWLDDRFIFPPETGDRLRHAEGLAGAETKWDLVTRAYAAMERVEQSPAQHCVVVSHGGTATFLLAAWIDMPREETVLVSFRFTSGGITTLRTDDRYHSHQITELNRTDHLHGTDERRAPR